MTYPHESIKDANADTVSPSAPSEKVDSQITQEKSPQLQKLPVKENDDDDDEVEEEEESHEVVVLVYDLSHGLAAQFAPQILGINLDAIYHTSVMVYGKEYFINQGIQINPNPGFTKYGTPIEVIEKGNTFISEDIFNEFLDDLRNHDDGKYHAHKYDLFDNNCNHFTDVLLDFLVGSNLDKRILHLPQQVLNTPNGQLLRQLIGNGNELM
ncbi:PPPDE putative peptidase domain-containing protein [Scheffersomyces amazonensis]|uniref:PPPDE putative peptidase domain-containing protein n=1 Tax=Scheffersomyces amazonensis TaxID=1078765 RepID=UPI00315CAEB7